MCYVIMYFLSQYIVGMLQANYNLLCQPADYSTSPAEMRVSREGRGGEERGGGRGGGGKGREGKGREGERRKEREGRKEEGRTLKFEFKLFSTMLVIQPRREGTNTCPYR